MTTLEANNDNDVSHPVWTHKAWLEEATKRFSNDESNWAFVCPMCKSVSRCQDFADLGVSPGRVATECRGRVLNEQGQHHKPDNDTPFCDWAAFGLIRGPVTVIIDDGDDPSAAFRFADRDATPTPTPATTTDG